MKTGKEVYLVRNQPGVRGKAWERGRGNTDEQ